VCIEAKFLYDAQEGFGTCGQLKRKFCAGFYGKGSDLRTNGEALCRLGEREGKRDPRSYWELGRTYFQPEVFKEQNAGQTCPFADFHYQLMRNFLFAATATATDNRKFGVLAIVPQKKSGAVRSQVAAFRQDRLLPSLHGHVGIATYDVLVSLLLESPHRAT